MPGATWRWLYLEKNQQGKYEAYYIEKYQVIDKRNDFLTIEMSSSPSNQKEQTPHHRFIIDFKKCERASKDPRYKKFSVTLYTKSLETNQWTLVSNTHKDLIFTEKFNCSTPFPAQKVSTATHNFNGEKIKVFQIKDYPAQKFISWYALNHSRLKGVALSKAFSPNGSYKFKLLDFKL